MGSGYFGEPNLGNERSSGSSSSSSSSKKGKKTNLEKPKQPQRGLGVAQLEKIRLHSQMGSSSTYLPSLPLQNPSYPINGVLNQEDMRQQTAYSSSSSSSYGFLGQQNFTMGFSDVGRANIRFGDSQPTTTARWQPGVGVIESHHVAQPNMTRHLFNLQAEEIIEKRRKESKSGSSSQNSQSSDNQEVDLELKL